MTKPTPLEEAAQLATEALNRQHPSPSYWLRYKDAPVVSIACIRDLRDAGRLTDLRNGLVDAEEVQHIFERTRIIDGVGLSVLRVSITPLGPSGPCDPLPTPTGIRRRRFAGWDFLNRNQLDDAEQWAGIEGVWPISEKTARQASMPLHGTFFLPAMKGFVDGTLIRRVKGYHLDCTTNRRWIETEPLDNYTRPLILTRRGDTKECFKHVWINVPQGPIANFTPEQADNNAEDSSQATHTWQV